MSHLVEYEAAEYAAENNPCRATYLRAARAALEVHGHKNANQLRWLWADRAEYWAEKAGLGNYANFAFGHGRAPVVDKLRSLLEGVR